MEVIERFIVVPFAPTKRKFDLGRVMKYKESLLCHFNVFACSLSVIMEMTKSRF